ncbi:MAG: hypothetical protein WCF77_03100 [Minisyncoccia bacterium]|jgi:uncharacterized membrane protein
MDPLFAFTLVAIVLLLGATVYVASETKRILPAALLLGAAYLMLFAVNGSNVVGPNIAYPSRVDTAPVAGTSRIWAFAANPLGTGKVLKVDVNRRHWVPRTE